MPVVSMMRIEGDVDAMLERSREHVDPVAARLAAKHGGLLNIVARDGDDALLIVNVWETEDGRHAIASEPELQQAMLAAGLPAPAFVGYELVELRFTETGTSLLARA